MVILITALFLSYCQTNKFTNMSDLEKKARIFSNTEGTQSCKSMREVEYDTGRYVGYLAGFKDCQTEYEEKVNELLSALEQIANATQPFNAFENEVFVSVVTDIARKALSFNNAT